MRKTIGGGGWVPFTDMIGFRCAAKLYMNKISHNFIFQRYRFSNFYILWKSNQPQKVAYPT